jgi:hypothetical protein
VAQSHGDEPVARTWGIDELHQSFCVHFLVEPATLSTEIPGVQLLPAGAAGELHPALRSVITGQPEFSGWIPSRLCMLYFGRFESGGRRIREEQRRKAPMLALWTVAAAGTGAGSRQDVALELFTNSSSVEAQARQAGLEIQGARSTVGPAPEDEEGRPSPNERFGLRLGKAQITWEGRAAGDSAPMTSPLAVEFRGPGRRGGWVSGSLSLAARTSSGMIGALKVAGKGELATMLRDSPIRFVGPGYRGGGGKIRFQQ